MKLSTRFIRLNIMLLLMHFPVFFVFGQEVTNKTQENEKQNASEVKEDQGKDEIVSKPDLSKKEIIESTDNGKSSSYPSLTTFGLNPDILGTASNSVNLFSGDVNLPLNLISLTNNKGLDVSFSIVYNSNIQNQRDIWNLEAPTGILGLGWSVDYDKIVVDHKSTGSRHDDEFYLITSGTSNLLVRTGTDVSGKLIYELKNYQFWKILCDTTDERWEITKEDGTIYFYGGGLYSDANGKHSVGESVQWGVKWGNWIGNSSNVTGQQQFGIVWNISKIKNIWGDSTKFEYIDVKQRVGANGLYHTEASYLNKITDLYGRFIQLNYSNKSAYEYQDPHSDAPEPDGYQDRYEKIFLSSLEVKNENAILLSTIEFSYEFMGSGYTYKRKLKTITEKNNVNKSMPNIKFEYHTASPYHGMLSKVTFPLGGFVQYTYTTKTINNSHRNLTVDAPSGYEEPRIWIGSDYVIVTWYKPSTDSLRVYAYSWEGRWIPSNCILQIGQVNVQDGKQDFEIELQKDFFGLIEHIKDSHRYKYTHLFRKNINNPGAWLYNNFVSDIENHDDNNLHYFSGENFLGIIGAESGEIVRYNWNGSAWDSINIDHSYSGDQHRFYGNGSDNSFIWHYQNGDNTDIVKWYYRDELGNWQSNELNSTYSFNTNEGGNEHTYWTNGSMFALALIGGKQERLYQWDENFNVNQSPLLIDDIQDDGSSVFINDAFVGINDIYSGDSDDDNSFFLRYDGSNWHTKNFPHGTTIWMGNDYCLMPGQSGIIRLIYNPNINDWHRFEAGNGYYYSYSDINSTLAEPGYNYFVGYDCCINPNGEIKVYYHMPYDTGFTKVSYQIQPNTNVRPGVGFNYFIIQDGTTENAYFNFIQNSQWISPRLISETGRFVLKDGDSKLFKYSTPVSSNTAVSYNTPYIDDATTLELHRIVSQNFINQQNDYSVTSIIVNDGTQSITTNINFDETTATYDPSGTNAQYNCVTTTLGDGSSGYTKTYFYNGSTSHHKSLTGLSYKTEIYNSSNAKVSETDISYNVYSKQLGQKDVGYYVRQTSHSNRIDNVPTSQSSTYSTTTGLVTEQSIVYCNSVGQTETRYTYFKYGHELYPDLLNKNLFAPIIQTRTRVYNWSTSQNAYPSSSATTWKDWGSGKWAPHKSYTWKGTGSYDFNFALWSGTGEPASDWIKTSEIMSLLPNGAVQTSKDIDNIISSAIYDYQYYTPLAHFGNAKISNQPIGEEASFLSFETANETSGIAQNDYWSFYTANDFSNDAHTGQTSRKILQGNPVYGPTRDFKPTQQYRKYVLSCWVKTQSGFATNGGALVMMTKHNSETDHSVYPNVASANKTIWFGDTGGEWKYIETVIDLAQVRTDGSVPADTMLRIRCFPVNYDANHYFLVDDIRFSPYDAPFSATITERTYGMPVANLGGNGECSRYYYDEFQQSWTSSDITGQVTGVSAMYYSRKGNSDIYSASDPNTSVSVSAIDGGKVWDFNNGAYAGWTTSGNWSVTNNAFKITGSGTAQLTNYSKSDFGIRANIKKIAGSNNNFGIAIGNDSVSWDGQWKLKEGETLVEQKNLIFGEDWIFIVSERSLLFYADGRLIFKRILSQSQNNSISLFCNTAGVEITFDDVVLLEKVAVAMTYINASGRTMQSQALDGMDIIVNEPVYDNMWRAPIQAKSVRYTNTLFGYKTDYVTSFDWYTGNLSGDVKDSNNDGYFPYSRQVYENSPISRVIEAGLPGADFRIGQHSSKVINTNENGNSYYKTLIINSNSDTATTIKDIFGRTLTKQGSRISTLGLVNYPISKNLQFGDEVPPGSGTEKETTYPSSDTFTVSFTQTVSWSCYLLGGYDGQRGYTARFMIGTTLGGDNIVSQLSSGENGESFSGSFSASPGTIYYMQLTGNSVYSYASGNVGYAYKAEGTISCYPTVTYEYDVYGNLKKIYPPNYYNPPIGATGSSFVTTMNYDFFGRMIEKITPDAGSSKFKYDKAGRLRFSMDALGESSSPDTIKYIKYDVYGRTTEEGYYGINWASITESNSNDLTWPSTPVTWRKKYFYDGDGTIPYLKGRLIKVLTNNDMDMAEEVEETYTYDIYGRMPSKTIKVLDYDQNAYTTKYEYDLSGHVVKMTYPVMALADTLNISGTYGGEGNIRANNYLVINSEFSTTGNSEMRFEAGPGLVPDTTFVTYAFNKLGQLTSIGKPNDVDYYASYQYNVDGSLKEEKMNNGQITRTFSYNSPGWLTQLNDNYLTESIDYTANGYGGAGYWNGNITRLSFDYKFTGMSDYTYQFKYDKLSQILVADHNTINDGDMGIGQENIYDANGNFLRVKVNTTTKNYSYYTGSNKVKNTDGSTNNHYQYDVIGNMNQSTPKNITAISYDKFSNLTKRVSMSGSNSLYLGYDGTERRVYKKETVNSVNQEQIYLHDGMHPIIERLKSGHTTEYIMGPTGIIAVKTNGAECYIIKDHLGSTRVVVDKTGTVQSGYEYSSFGTLISSTGTNGLNYRFTGQEYDVITGLHNYKARMYDADLKNFYAFDPLEQTPNSYSYTGNNPVNNTDPNGLWFGIDDLIVSGVSFAVGYVSHGVTTGEWGKDALIAGGIAAGSAWLAYNTGGAAAGMLFDKGGAAYAMTSATIGGAVGGSTGSLGNQLYFNHGKVNWNEVGLSAISGAGGGLAGGAFGYYGTGDPVLTSMFGGAVGGGIDARLHHRNVYLGVALGGYTGAWSGGLTAGAYEAYGEYLYKNNYPEGAKDKWSCHEFREDFLNKTNGNEYVEFENTTGITAEIDLPDFGIKAGEQIRAVSHSGVSLGRNLYGQDFIISKLNVGLPVNVRTGTQLSRIYGTYKFVPKGNDIWKPGY